VSHITESIVHLDRSELGDTLATNSAMHRVARSQLGRLIVTPFATIGVLAAVLVWEIEHVGSILLAAAIAAGAVAIGIVVARQLRRDIDRIAEYYGGLLRTADEQSRQAESANRLKDDFLSTLSHELRTPLNSVLGWARLLASGKLDPTQTTHAVQAIERAGWAQSRLIEDLLDISRIVSGKLELDTRPTVVPPLVAAAVDALRDAAQAKRITVTVSLDATREPIAADPDRLQQVVWNLLSNAIKFTPSGGDVHVRLTSEHDELRLTVTDTGIGFNPDVAAHLFERFRQGDASTTRQHGGLGLGLGIVRHVVELHGGTVTAASAGVNLGSTFEVCIPIRPWATPLAAPLRAEPPAPSLRGVQVLMVDDDKETREFVRSTLEQYGAIVVTASTAEEAKARFRRQPPDVFVSDLVMPDEDGLQLIRDIRQLERVTGRVTPAAALTALVRSDDRRRALSAGYQMHMAKPIDPSELVSAVERLAQPPESYGRHN
jgi:signal transduction histidine kinase/ActR/RegA family two-component response regulator